MNNIINNFERFNINNFIGLIESESSYDRFMYLKICTVHDDELKEKYNEHIHNHLSKLFNKVSEMDAGFDILSPKPGDNLEYEMYGGIRCYRESINPVNKVDFRVKCSAEMYILNKFRISENEQRFIKHQTGFYMYPRSSLSKTNLRLANSTGIIDAGYRGNLIGMFDLVNIEEQENSYDYLIKPYTRLLQICAPSLVPIYVELVENENQLGTITERGSGGFGSTGM
jgi:dUTP pyrophosphatase